MAPLAWIQCRLMAAKLYSLGGRVNRTENKLFVKESCRWQFPLRFFLWNIGLTSKWNSIYTGYQTINLFHHLLLWSPNQIASSPWWLNSNSPFLARNLIAIIMVCQIITASAFYCLAILFYSSLSASYWLQTSTYRYWTGTPSWVVFPLY